MLHCVKYHNSLVRIIKTVHASDIIDIYSSNKLLLLSRWPVNETATALIDFILTYIRGSRPQLIKEISEEFLQNGFSNVSAYGKAVIGYKYIVRLLLAPMEFTNLAIRTRLQIIPYVCRGVCCK